VSFTVVFFCFFLVKHCDFVSSLQDVFEDRYMIDASL